MKLNKEYNFENFKVKKENKQAFILSQDIVKEPGKKYSPLFISGNQPERIHLLNAIANALEESNHKVSNNINEISNDTNILIIDKIENLSSKDENKLTKIIKDFISNKKQIILGSDKQLDELNITEELKETILWGISANIKEEKIKTNNAKTDIELVNYDWLK